MKSKLFWFLYSVQAILLITTAQGIDKPFKAILNIFIGYLIIWFVCKSPTGLLLYIRRILGLMVILYVLIFGLFIVLPSEDEIMHTIGILSVLFLFIVNSYVLAHQRAKVLGIDLVKLSKSNSDASNLES